MTTSDVASRMSSVPGLKESPQTAKVFPERSSPKRSTMASRISRFWLMLTASTASRIPASTPWSCMVRMSARTSLGKQLPPYPTPAKRKDGPIRSSVPTPARTIPTSAPTSSQRRLIMFMKEMRVASMALAAYFVISAEAMSMKMRGFPVRTNGA